jgi:hypothetical protein
MSKPSSRPMACPAAEIAPEAPNVQNRYRAESAGIARPDVIAVVWRDSLVLHEGEGRNKKDDSDVQ